jgi:hypothetical protein
MTRTRWLIAGSWLLLFWLLAGTVWAPAIQRELTRSAAQLFHAAPDNHPPITVSFQGQHARLQGKVRHADQRANAEIKAREGVRATTALAANLEAGLNPVTAVTNEIEVVPFPPGWIMLAAQGPYARLSGIAATDFEARDIIARVQDRWSAQGGRLEAAVTPDSARFDEAPDAETTLTAVPPPKTAGGDSAQIQIARLGNDWQRLPLEASDERLRDQTLALGLTETEWQHQVAPALQTARTYQKAERAREAEIQRQAALPPPHVFLAARDHRVLLKGEIASLGLKRELLNSTIAAFPDWKVLDDIRVNPKRRSVSDFGPITTALLPQPLAQRGEPAAGKSLALGLSGQGWQMLDWQVGGDKAKPWLEALPKDLPADMVTADGVFVVEWLQGNAQGIPVMPLRAQPSFLTLTLLPDRVILAGQVAEESLRAQLIEAAQRTYGGRAIIMSDGLLARGTCEPSSDVQQTIRSLPPLPEPKQPPILAFARPGQVWKSAPATPDLLKAGGMANSELVPKDFPATMAEDTFADAFDHVRAQWQEQAPISPAPPASPPAPNPAIR